MARQRDRRAEYRARLARAAERGQTTREARGHGGTPSSPWDALRHPDRYSDYIGRHEARMRLLSQTEQGRRIIDRANERRRDAGEVPIEPFDRPEPFSHTSRETFSTPAEAQGVAARAQGYTVVFRTAGGRWSIRWARDERRRYGRRSYRRAA